MAALSSTFFGFADFVGGVATRRAPVLTVATLSQSAGLLIILALGPLIPAGGPLGTDLAWGAAAGATGAIGLVALYQGLAVARMGVVAPVTALVTAVVPVAFGLATGERPGWLAIVGVLAAFPAILLVAAPTGARWGFDRGTGLGAAAGASFGVFVILIARTAPESGIWPLASARVVAIAALAAAVLATRHRLRPGNAKGLIALATVLDTAASVLAVLALQRALLVLAAVLASLYPAWTVLAARLILDEPITPRQYTGMALTGLAVVLIAVG